MQKEKLFGNLIFVLICSLLVYSPKSKAVGRELITSATYGVIAGTIVGAATLAFTSNPGDNLSRIARGASLGLYAGLALGFYVTYGVSDEIPEDEYAALSNRQRGHQGLLAVYPTFSNNGLDGAGVSWLALSF